jgi:hypothetical protein
MCFGTWAGTGRGTYLPPDKESKGYRKILLTMIFKKHFRKKMAGPGIFFREIRTGKIPGKNQLITTKPKKKSKPLSRATPDGI